MRHSGASALPDIQVVTGQSKTRCHSHSPCLGDHNKTKCLVVSTYTKNLSHLLLSSCHYSNGQPLMSRSTSYLQALDENKVKIS